MAAIEAKNQGLSGWWRERRVKKHEKEGNLRVLEWDKLVTEKIIEAKINERAFRYASSQDSPNGYFIAFAEEPNAFIVFSDRGDPKERRIAAVRIGSDLHCLQTVSGELHDQNRWGLVSDREKEEVLNRVYYALDRIPTFDHNGKSTWRGRYPATEPVMEALKIQGILR